MRVLDDGWGCISDWFLKPDTYLMENKVSKSDFTECVCGHMYEDHITIVDGEIVTGGCRVDTCPCDGPRAPNGLPEDIRLRMSFDLEQDGTVAASTIEGTFEEVDSLRIAEYLLIEYKDRAEADGQSADGPSMAATMIGRYLQVKGI